MQLTKGITVLTYIGTLVFIYPVMHQLLKAGAIAILVLFTGCEKEIGSVNHDQIAVSLDIKDAEYLCLDGTSSNAKTNLLKTVAGEPDMVPVNFLNNNLEPIDSSFCDIRITHYYRLDNGLICLTGRFEMISDSAHLQPEILTSLLVDLETGNIYDFLGHYPENVSYYMGSDSVQQDDMDNLYYSHGYKIYLLSGQKDKVFSIQQYLPDGQDFFEFFIDRSGNCFYNQESPRSTKVKLSSGGILQSPVLINNFFYRGTDLMAIHSNKLVKIDLNESVQATPADSMENEIEHFSFLYPKEEEGYTLFLQYGTSELNSGYFGIAYFHQTDKAYRIDLAEDCYLNNPTFQVEGIEDHYLFLRSLDNSEILRIDLDQMTPSGEGYLLHADKSLIMPSEYEIYSLQLYEGLFVTFTGLRYSDEKIVMAELDFDGLLSIISETLNRHTIVLEKVN